MSDCKTPHHLIDLDLDRISDFCIGHEDDKTLNPGNAIALASSILDLDIVFFSNLYWCGWSGSTH